MTYVKNVLKISALGALAFTALLVFGLMFAVATNPAQAGAPRPADPAAQPNPVTVQMQQQLTSEIAAFKACLGPRFFEDRPAMATLEAAQNAAGWGAAERNLAKFNAEAAKARAELARLKPAYGC